MKVAFWSNNPGCCVTSNMVAVGAAMSQLYRMKITLISNHFERQNLGYITLGREYDRLVNEGCKYFVCGDERYSLRKILTPSSESPLNANSLDGLEDGLYYYFQERLYSDSLHSLDSDEFNRLVNQLEEKSDYVFMDLQSQGSICSIRQLELADVIVVNLKQDAEAANDFFKQYGSMTGKCFFLLSDYKRDGKLLKKDLVNNHKVHPDNIAAIAHNHEFTGNVSDGRIIPYIVKYLDCPRNHRQYYTIWNIKNTAKLLLALLTYKKNEIDGEEELQDNPLAN